MLAAYYGGRGGSACPLWVIRDQSIQPQGRPLSAVSPIADKRGCGWNVR